MTATASELLEHLAGTTVYVNGAEYSADTIEPKTFAALRAVLDLHKPATPPPGHSWVSGGAAPKCEGCDSGDPFLDPDYPCDTVKAIAAALEAP